MENKAHPRIDANEDVPGCSTTIKLPSPARMASGRTAVVLTLAVSIPTFIVGTLFSVQ